MGVPVLKLSRTRASLASSLSTWLWQFMQVDAAQNTKPRISITWKASALFIDRSHFQINSHHHISNTSKMETDVYRTHPPKQAIFARGQNFSICLMLEISLVSSPRVRLALL